MKKISTLLFIATFSLSKATTSLAQVNTQDSLAVVALYNNTHGGQWTNHTNWLTTAPLSTWYGITLDNTHTRVTQIDLQQNNLNGHLGSSFGNLTSLYYLQLNDNPLLTDSLPSSFKNLISLIQIYIYRCNLLGTLKVLESIPNPFDFEFSHNNFSGSLPNLQNMQAMAELDLDYNQFSGPIPESYGYIGGAGSGVLYLNDNKLTGKIPQSFGASQQPRGGLISLGDNWLEGPVPANLSNAYSNVFFISNNYFNFDSIEYILSINPSLQFGYSPQRNIPIHYTSSNGTSKLSVSAGGTLSKDTFHWYRNNILFKTIVGDSVLDLDFNGTYYVKVTNSVATKLTLVSDSFVYNNSFQITVSNITVTEGNSGYTPANFKIKLTNASTKTVRVSYTTKNGSAVAGQDYVAKSGTIAILPGDTSKTITVNIIGDQAIETNEKFYLLLSNPKNAVLNIKDSSICTIKNDDNSPLAEKSISTTESENTTINVFPNPANNTINISLPQNLSSNSYAVLYDINGKTVLQQTLPGSTTQQLSVTNIPSGNYSLVIMENNKMVYQKGVVVIH